MFNINRIGGEHFVLDICELVYCLHHQLLIVRKSETLGTYSLADYYCSCGFEEGHDTRILRYLITFIYL